MLFQEFVLELETVGGTRYNSFTRLKNFEENNNVMGEGAKPS